MKIVDQANAILGNLLEWAQARGGVAAIVSNLQELWKQAYMATEKPRILIAYDGEKSRGDFAVMSPIHRVDRRWVVAVTRGRGFWAERGDSLSQTKQNAEPFYTSVETIRDRIRVQLGISEENYVDYEEIEPIEHQGVLIDGYLIRFSTANDLPQVIRTPDNLAMPPLEPPQPII